MRRSDERIGGESSFTPLQVEQRELAEGLEPIEARDPRYTRARVLVRVHSKPVGLVDVPLPADSDALASAIERRLGEAAHGSPRERLTDPPHVTVVVPTRDRPDDLARCLDSLIAVAYPPERLEVIVVDNVPSREGARAVADRYGVRYVRCDRPGSAAARNDGVRAAEGEIVAFTDDDVLVDRQWLAELALGFREAAGVACVTGLVLPLELDTPAQMLFQEYGGFGKGFEQRVFRAGMPAAGPVFPFNPGTLGSGNNVAFRRDALLDLGGYDERLGNGTPTRSGEDWELFLRLLRAGRTAVYRPGALVHHRDRRGMDELRAQLRDYGVGMGAAITRTVAHDPRAALELLARAPRVARYVLSPSAQEHRHQSRRFPRALRRAELAGLLRGPLAYARSRRS